MITIPNKQLKHALTGIKHVIGPSVYRYVKFTQNDKGRLSLTGTNRDECAEFWFDSGAEPCEFLLSFDQLSQVVKGLDGKGGISFEPGADGKTVGLAWNAQGCEIHRKLDTLPVEEFPFDLGVIATNKTALDTRAKKATLGAFEVCYKGVNRYAIAGAWLCSQHGSIIGTDGRQLIETTGFTFDFGNVLLPESKFLTWKPFHSDGDWLISVNPKASDHNSRSIVIQSDNWRYTFRENLHSMPNYTKVIPTEHKTRVAITVDVALKLMAVVNSMPQASKDSPGVKVAVNQQGLTISCLESTATILANVVGLDIVTCLDRNFIRNALLFGCDSMDLTDEISPIVFNGTLKTYVAMPMRTN